MWTPHSFENKKQSKPEAVPLAKPPRKRRVVTGTSGQQHLSLPLPHGSRAWVPGDSTVSVHGGLSLRGEEPRGRPHALLHPSLRACRVTASCVCATCQLVLVPKSLVRLLKAAAP